MEFYTEPEPVAYETALAGMEARVNGIHAGTQGEQVWLLEHPPLYTGGTSANPADLRNPQFPVYTAGRGGEYTYHGPGQRVAYVMLNLKNHQQPPDIKKYVWQLEEWIIRALAQFDVRGERRAGRVGIWVVTPQGEKKIAAIGVRIRHWITFHGVAINVHPDLSHFNGIVPCGLSEYGVTSLHVLGVKARLADIDNALQESWGRIFS